MVRRNRQNLARLARFVALVFLASLPGITLAQRVRITGKINGDQWTPVHKSVHPNALSDYDRGKAADSLQLSSVVLVLKPSASQQADLDQLLADQQNPASGKYHKWLTPEEYADRFGLAQSDIDRIVKWVKSQSLMVTGVARARNAVTVAGSAAQVGRAFHTEIHMYEVNGETHYANATEPSVPAAMQDVVGAIGGLHNFRLKPRSRMLAPVDAGVEALRPDYTSSSTGNHYLAPDDFATIFDITPLYNTGIDGASQSIVIVGQSQILPSHLSAFTSYFGMPAVNLTTLLVPNTRDPGISEADEQESDLDVEWAAAVARGASLVFVYSYDVNDAVRYAIDQNLGPVLSMSYGDCEHAGTEADAATMRIWAQQANAQGITWVTASGDSGAASCYQAASGPFGSANNDLSTAVDIPANLPEVTGVGGTTFNEGSGAYWNATNSGTRASAQSYIPEVSWNDSVSDGSPAASGGGASLFFSKPSWQTGAGVPNDGARDVPDVAFPASADHDGYMVYTTSGRQTGWYVFGGTSCGAPTFSGLLGLLNQYLVLNGYQAAGGLGNINPHLYALARSTANAFHDITSGNNVVVASTCTGPRCTGSSTVTSGGYNAGAGYDPVTGLGSVDAYTFVTAWHTGSALSKGMPAIALSVSPGTLTAAGAAMLTATVTGGYSITPTGAVTFSTGGTILGTAMLSGASGTATAMLRVAGSAAGLSLNANTITAIFEGDGAYNGATATGVLTLIDSSSVTPAIAGLANAASYRQSYAPGMALSIFGSSLALTSRQAGATPLPASLDNISVTINGVSAPLYYISPTQLNVQIPYETPGGGTATLVVSNNGQTASTSMQMAAAAPGIFTNATGGIVPSPAAVRGQTVVMFATGAGALNPPVATASTPGSAVSPVPAETTLVTVGGVPASTTYIGVPNWSVGVLQINFVVPSNIPVGSQPVVVSVGGLASAAATLDVSN